MNSDSFQKILYYDCFSGISGDMNLAALLEIGVEEKILISELNKLQLEGWSIEISKDHKNGIWGTKVTVNCQKEHHHRTFDEISKIITQSTLSQKVKDQSLQIFELIAKAEAKVHNTNFEKIHFHEVGALDSIIDIVGASICLDILNVDKIVCSPIELGGGFVKCAHGKIPVPAPAVVEILNGIPVKSGAAPYETTTPTGAAILAATVEEFTNNINFQIEKTAYGIGHRDMEIPNALRVYLGFESKSTLILKDEEWMLECNIDDMNPEFYDYLFERLFEAGASDVFITPIIMKKTRPAHKLSVLYKFEFQGVIRDLVYRNTTTLGFREYKVAKNVLERNIKTIQTKYGKIRIKEAFLNGELIRSKPEYDDCKALAIKHGINISEIFKEI